MATRKKRLIIDLPQPLVEKIGEEMARTPGSRNEIIALLIERGLDGRDWHPCPLCGHRCRQGEPGCVHFDPVDMTWSAHKQSPGKQNHSRSGR